MEEFFYIILLVIWIVVSLIKRNKAKRAAEEPVPKPAQKTTTEKDTGQTPPRELDLEEVLGELFGKGKKQPVPEPLEEGASTAAAGSSKRPAGAREPVYRAEESVPRSRTYADHGGAAFQQELEEYAEELGVQEDYEFSAEGKVETIEDLISRHAAEDARLQAADEFQAWETADDEGLDEVPDFDLQTAVVFSEILNKKYQ